MFAYINRMNALGIGHFSMGGLPTIDWNEEAILDELMQPRDETTPVLTFQCQLPCSTATSAEQHGPPRTTVGEKISFR